MLIEVKTKVTRITEDRTRKVTETYLTEKEFFSEAEYQVTSILSEEQSSHLVEGFEIQSLKVSSIKEVAVQYEGELSFIVTLKDIFHEDDGTEKHLRYKVLLWADNLTQANQRVQEMAREGYDMQIEGIRQVDYTYLQTEQP